jgi:hypothetical protein
MLLVSTCISVLSTLTWDLHIGFYVYIHAYACTYRIHCMHLCYCVVCEQASWTRTWRLVCIFDLPSIFIHVVHSYIYAQHTACHRYYSTYVAVLTQYTARIHYFCSTNKFYLLIAGWMSTWLSSHK